MKRKLIAIFMLALMLFTGIADAITKTTTIDEVDAWQAVAAATMVVGNADSVADSFSTIVYLEVAYSDADAQAGVDIQVEISYGDDNWMLLQAFTTTADDPATTTINDATVNAGDTTITLALETLDFTLPGRKWFIVDGTVANSESVKTVSNSTTTVTLAQDLIRSHADSLNVFDFVYETVISIPVAASQWRILVNNTDADAGVHFTTRVSKVTAL